MIRRTGAEHVSRAVVRFDDAIERGIDRWRGHPTLDRAMYAASELGDFSLIWHMVNAGRALAPDRAPVHAVRVAAILGAESLLVNQGVKRLIGRRRPPWEQERPHKLRRPTTSSFPSGHASAAAVAITILSENDPLWPLYVVLGATVAVSRVYVKVHHPSDVIAGAVVGLAIASLARRLWPFPT